MTHGTRPLRTNVRRPGPGTSASPSRKSSTWKQPARFVGACSTSAAEPGRTRCSWRRKGTRPGASITFRSPSSEPKPKRHSGRSTFTSSSATRWNSKRSANNLMLPSIVGCSTPSATRSATLVRGLAKVLLRRVVAHPVLLRRGARDRRATPSQPGRNPRCLRQRLARAKDFANAVRNGGNSGPELQPRRAKGVAGEC